MMSNMLSKISPATVKQWSRRRKVLTAAVAAALVLIVVVGTVWAGKRGGEGPAVVVEPVQLRELEAVVYASGTLRPVDRQVIFAGYTGSVSELTVRAGDRVEAGQVLGRLDMAEPEKRLRETEATLAVQEANLARATAPLRPEEEAQEAASLIQAGAVLEDARKKLARAEYLHQEGAISTAELEQARLDFTIKEAALQEAESRSALRRAGPGLEELASLQAQYNQARLMVDLAAEQVERGVFRAAIDGFVLGVDAEKGAQVAAGSRIMQIGDTSALEVEAVINESDSGVLALGQEVRITSMALAEAKFNGRLTQVNPAVVPGQTERGEVTGVPVRVKVDDQAGLLKPGYTVDLTIITVPARRTLTVPYEALVERDNGPMVYVYEQGKVNERVVERGINNELFVEITAGLEEGAKVVLDPPEDLSDGMAVRVTEHGKVVDK